MRCFFRRLRQQTRWRIYARILPVVALAVLVVGAFGWAAFTRYAANRVVAHDQDEVAYIQSSLRDRTLLQVMRLENRRTGAGTPSHHDDCLLEPGFCRNWRAGQARDERLRAVAVVGPDTTGAAWIIHETCLPERSGSAPERARITSWFAREEERVRAGSVAVPATGPDPTAPVLVARKDGQATYVFPPLPTEGPGAPTLLPVLVREESAGPAGRHPIYFLDFGRMMTDVLALELVHEPDTWWCLVDLLGRVVDASGDVETGRDLRAQPRRESGPFSATDGAALAGDWRPGEPWPHTVFGSRLSPWIVTAGQTNGLPFVVLVGHEAHELRSLSLGYLAAIIAIALLAQAVAIFGVTRVVDPVAGRMTELSRNMEQVAAGDYARRISDDSGDEVSRLIGYFNRMAENLEATRLQLSEQTRHLETALENRQMLDRAKDDFLVLISHEVRTPLTAMLGGVDIIKSLVGRAEGPEQEMLVRMNLVEVLNIVETNGQRLHGFMNDAIQMTTVQSSEQKLKLAPEPVGSVVEMGLCGVREMARLRDIDVRNELERVDDWFLLCDARVLTMAFEKVLKNAVVHNHEGGHVLVREVDGIPDEPDLAQIVTAENVHRLMSQESFERFSNLPVSWRVIEIFNSGEVIPAERKDALFGKFELVGRIENHHKGSGLSLPIARAAVEHHGGSIFLHTITLLGNSFYLVLPTIDAADVANLPPTVRLGSGEKTGDGLFGGPGDKNVGEVADPARLKVEFRHDGATIPGDSD